VRLAVTVQNTKAVLDTPLKEAGNPVMTVGHQHSIDATGNNGNILQALAQEMMKLMKGNQPAEQTDHTNASYAHFAGIFSCKPDSISSQSSICCVVHSDSGSWILDTGASVRTTPNLALFANHTSLLKPIHVKLPDGTLKLISHARQVTLSPTVTLNNVLHVPEFKHNLLYVGKLLSDNKLCAIFYPDSCFFQDLSTRLNVATRKKAGGLYFLHQNPAAESKAGPLLVAGITSSEVPLQFDSTFCVHNKPACNVEILHARLGHTSHSKMQHIPICKDLLSTFTSCETCIMAKLHRLPFNNSHVSTTHSFQLIHMALWGPYRAANVARAHYFLTPVDDFTRYTWTQLLHDKTQVANAII